MSHYARRLHRVSAKEASVLIRLTGTLDMETGDRLREEARWLITEVPGATRRRLLVDLSGIAECPDDTGLYVLLGMSRVLRGLGIDLLLISVSAVVETQIERSRLQSHLRRDLDEEPRDDTSIP